MMEEGFILFIEKLPKLDEGIAIIHNICYV